MYTILYQYQAIICIKQCCHCFKPIIKSRGSFPKISMDIYVRDLHNDIIKPYYNYELKSVVYSVTQKLLIIDTTLRLFIPPQVRKMTPKLLQLCICEPCIIPRYINIYLNVFRKILVIY